MSLVGDVIQEGRDVLREFDESFLENNDKLYDVVLGLEKALLPIIIRIAKTGIELPGDESENIDVSSWAYGYDLPETFWRHRDTRLNVSTGRILKVQVVPNSWEQNLPPVEPSMFLRGGQFFPIDGVEDGSSSSRTLGWSGAESVDIDFVTEPAVKTADTDELELPEVADRFAAYDLARFMATRGKAADSTVQQIRGDRQETFDQLLQDIGSFPGAVPAPTGG